jgi:glutamine synthetase type III
MSLKVSLEKLKADTRMRQIYVKNGVLNKKELEEQTKNLPDLSSQTVKLEFEK